MKTRLLATVAAGSLLALVNASVHAQSTIKLANLLEMSGAIEIKDGKQHVLTTLPPAKAF